MAIEFLLPPKEQTTISVTVDDNTKIEVEVIDVVEAFQRSQEDCEKLGSKDWITHFISKMKNNHSLKLSRTAAMMLVNVATGELIKIKKSCLPEVEQLGSTT